MTELIGLEHIRATVSANLTRILMLYGRLQPASNVRYLPLTIRSVLILIDEMQELEKKYYGLAEILKENIQRREKHSKVFSIPSLLQAHPNIKGLRLSLYELSWPLIKTFCEEEKAFLESGHGSVVSHSARRSLLERAISNCELLFAWCLPQESILLLELKLWCESEITRGDTACISN